MKFAKGKFEASVARANKRNSRLPIQFLYSFPVAISEGSHPFPSRTRKLSPLELMVLRGQLRGRVGSCRINFRKAVSSEYARDGFFIFPVRNILCDEPFSPCPENDRLVLATLVVNTKTLRVQT